jgi:hypothetical protein
VLKWQLAMRLVCAAALALCGLAACVDAGATFVPVSFALRNGKAFVGLERVDVLKRNAEPTLFPMFRDLISTTGRQPMEVPFEQLRSHLDSTDGTAGQGLFPGGDSVPSASYSDATPAGFVFHESRVGSTLVANSYVCVRTLGCSRGRESCRCCATLRVEWNRRRDGCRHAPLFFRHRVAASARQHALRRTSSHIDGVLVCLCAVGGTSYCFVREQCCRRSPALWCTPSLPALSQC